MRQRRTGVSESCLVKFPKFLLIYTFCQSEENHDGTICSQYWSAEEGSSEESGGRNTSTSSEASSGRSTRTGSLLRFNRVLYSTTTTETDEDIELGGDPSQPLPPWTTRASERLWQLLSLLQTLAVRGGQFGVAAAGCLFHSAGHLLMWSLQHQWDAVIRGITVSIVNRLS